MEVLHQLIMEPNLCQCFDCLQAHGNVQRKHTKQLPYTTFVQQRTFLIAY